DPELLSFQALLHALRHLGLFVSLQQRLVLLLQGGVVARLPLVLLLAPGRIVRPPLVGRDGLAEGLLLVLERLELRVDLLERVLVLAALVLAGRGGVPTRAAALRRGRRFRRLLGALALEGGDLALHADDIRVLVAEAGAELGELVLELGEPRGDALGPPRW